jgi:MFS family permease
MTDSSQPGSGREATRSLYVLCLSLFFWSCGGAQIAFLQPLYLRLLGASPVQVGIALAAQSAASALCLLPGGYLSDRFQRRTLMLLSWSLGTLGIASMAGAGNLLMMTGAMVVYGACSFGNPAMSHYLAELNLERTTWSFTLLTAAGRLGTVISPAAGAYLAQHASPRVAYVVSASLCLLSTAILFGLAKQPSGGQRPLIDSFRSMFTDPALVALIGPLLIVYCAGALADSFASNFLRDAGGLQLAAVGRMGSVSAIGATLFVLLAGQLSRRRMPLARLMAAGFGVASLGLLVLVGLANIRLAAGLAIALFGAAYFLRGADVGGRALVNAHLAQSLRRESVGMGFGLVNLLFSLSSVIGPAMAGWLYARDPSWPFLTALVLLPLGASALIWQVRRTGGARPA